MQAKLKDKVKPTVTKEKQGGGKGGGSRPREDRSRGRSSASRNTEGQAMEAQSVLKRDRSASSGSGGASLIGDSLGGLNAASAVSQDVGESLLAAAAKKRGANPTEQQVDVTKGWKLSAKDLNEEGLRRLVLMIGALSMTTSLSAKILAGIIIFRLLVPVDSPIRAAIREVTTSLHELRGSLPKEDRKELPQPFIVAAEALVTSCATLASEKLDDANLDRRRIVQYADLINGMGEEDRQAKLLEDWRYVRTKGTWDRTTAIIEIGLGPLAGQQARDCYKGIRQLMIRHGAARELTGIAPMSAIERRISHTLKQLKVWK